MICEELRHDLCMVTFPTDYVVEYHGKILVGDDRRSTGIIPETCEEVRVTIGMMNRHVHTSYLSPGFSDCRRCAF